MDNTTKACAVRSGVLFAGMAVLLLGLAAAYSEAEDVSLRNPGVGAAKLENSNPGKPIVPSTQVVQAPRLSINAGSPHDLVMVGKPHIHDGATAPVSQAGATYIWRMAYCAGLSGCDGLLQARHSEGQEDGDQPGTVQGDVSDDGTIPGPVYTPPKTGMYVLELKIGSKLTDAAYTADRVVSVVVVEGTSAY